MGDNLDVHTNVQKAGVLYKRPFGHESSKWSKRFFVLKDGFMLYYPEKDGREFNQSGTFNIHPKGVIPLGGCFVEEIATAEQPFGLKITHPDFGDGKVIVAADTDESRQEWLDMIHECARVTYKNAQMGETMIKCLKAKTGVIEQEKREANERFQAESLALAEEKRLREELEEHAAQLKQEKADAETRWQQLMADRDDQIRRLQETQNVIKQTEEAKAKLEAKAKELEVQISSLESQSQESITQHQSQLERMAKEKQSLADATQKLVLSLKTMEERARLLEQERESTKTNLQQAEAQAKRIAQEMINVTQVASTLERELGVTAEERARAMSKAEKEERERKKLEKKLKLAEDALARLEKALRDSGVKIDIQMEADVKKLKQFFEDVMDDHFWQTQKSHFVKDAVTATSKFRKADTVPEES